VGPPENLQEGCKGKYIPVETDFNNFRMSGFSGGYLSVIRIGYMTAGIARPGGNDAFDPFEDGLNAPEASAAQDDAFSVVRHFQLLAAVPEKFNSPVWGDATEVLQYAPEQRDGLNAVLFRHQNQPGPS
jgi:hypothetical protein